MTFGEKIQRLRKQQGLSQETLAEKVTVTRQTISKWELDQSTPDLDFIAQLSNIFGVSADYLIKEELVEPDEIPMQKKKFQFSEKARRTTLVIVSAAALAAICVCLICDYFTSKSLSWSLVSAVSIAATWCIALPCLTAKKGIVLKTLIAVSIVPTPFLAMLALLLKLPIIFTMGICIMLVALVAIWVIYGIFCKCHGRLWKGAGFALLVLIPVSIAITHISALFMLQYQFDFTSDVFNSCITLILSVVCFGADYLIYHRKREADEK